MLDAAPVKMSPYSNAWSNDIEFSGERKRVRCNEGLGHARASVAEMGTHGC